MKIKLAVCMILMSLPLPGLCDESLSVFINRREFSPGQTIKFQLPKRYHVPPTVTWKNKDIAFEPTFDNNWRALIPIPMKQAKGEEIFYITPNTPAPGGLFEGPITVTMKEGAFGSETIKLPDEKMGLLNKKEEERESKLIRELIKASISDETQHWRGLFLAPVPGKVISEFGLTRRRVGQEGTDFHRGVDIDAKLDDPVRATNIGVVLLAKEFNIHGRTVLLSHGQGVASIYLHLNSIGVKEGDLVQTSQEIGKIGSTGISTKPHLHWGVYVKGQAVDPLQWLQEEF